MTMLGQSRLNRQRCNDCGRPETGRGRCICPPTARCANPECHHTPGKHVVAGSNPMDVVMGNCKFPGCTCAGYVRQ